MQQLAHTLSLAFILFTSAVVAQETSLSGQVVNASGAPVAYANVYFPAAETGAVTDADGRFRFPAFAKTVGPFDTLVVSSIGYRDTALSVRAVRELAGAPVVLAKADYVLAGVEVSEARLQWGARERVGKRLRKPWFGTCAWGASEIGSEAVIEVKNKGRRRLEAVVIQPEFISGDSALVEVNIYRLGEGGLPVGPLQRAPIRTLVPASARRGDHTVDFSAAGVVVDGDFAVGIEPLVVYRGGEAVDLPGGRGIMLRMPCSDWRSSRLRSFQRSESGVWQAVAVGGGVYAYGRRAD